MQKQISRRKVGQIRQISVTGENVSQGNALPHTITDLAINGVNLYSESKHLDCDRNEIFNKYEDIIKDL